MLHDAKAQEALPILEQLVAEKPDDWECWGNLAYAFKVAGDWAAALEHYEKAAAIKPDDDQLCAELARMYKATGQYRLSLEWFYKALTAKPESEDYFLEWIGALSYIGHQEDAFKCLQQTWDEEPENIRLAVAMMPIAINLAEWDYAERAEALVLKRYSAGSYDDVPFFTMLALSGFDRVMHRHFTEARVKYFPCDAIKPMTLPVRSDKSLDRPLRIAYLSADYFEHATTRLINGVLLEHSAAGMEAYLYSYGPPDAGVRRRELEVGVACFRDVRLLSPEKVAAQIIEDEIDILVDLKGWTKDYRVGIQALRPAPVIINWLGYPGTLGSSKLADYVLGDSIVTPLSHAGEFTEKIAQMPHSYMPTDNRCEVPPPFTREELGLPEEAVVFASFNRLDKLTRQMFSTWCKILANVPNSVLWLWCDQPRARTQLQKAAASLGVAPERILFAPSESHRNHLARLQCVDLALDTFPYTSHTTGVDALWVGVPLLAMQGETFASRVSASHMHSVGLPELIAYSHDEYAAKAIALAEDRAQLQAYRHHLVSTRAALPLFDTQRFTRNLAALYQRIWQNHCAGIHEALPAIPD